MCSDFEIWKHINIIDKSFSYHHHFAIGCSLLTCVTSLFAVFSKYGTILSITTAIRTRIRANCLRIYSTSSTGACITTSRRCTRVLSAWCTWASWSPISTYSASFFAVFVEILLVTSVTSTQSLPRRTADLLITHLTLASGTNIRAVRFRIPVWGKLRSIHILH